MGITAPATAIAKDCNHGIYGAIFFYGFIDSYVALIFAEVSDVFSVVIIVSESASISGAQGDGQVLVGRRFLE